MLTRVDRILAVSTRHGPSELERVDYLDGWRGLAILLVLADHFLPTQDFESGILGVDVFFCLSGALMSRILFVKRTPLSTFYKRRISRILPVFLLFVLVIHAVALLVGWAFTHVEFLATLTFLRTYVPSSPVLWSSALPIGHLWSLNVEEHCYVLLSLLTLPALVRGREGWVLIGLGCASIAMFLFYAEFPAIAPEVFEIRTEAAASCLLISAGYCLVRERFVRFVQPWMPIAATLLAGLMYWRLHLPWWAPEIVAPFLLAFAVNHLAEAAAWFKRLLATAPMRLMGLWSYSIYLWQQPFYIYKAQFGAAPAVVLLMAVSLASFYLFENPVRSWLNRHW
jgi:peptidoglycan/LPS O-acetylase OafA/YrhL